MSFDEQELEVLNREFEGLSPREILAWALANFEPEEIVATSSFQTQSLPLLHMISQLNRELRVFFLDTGFHFPETLSYRDTLVRKLHLKVVNIRPESFPPEELYRRDSDACCALNKVKPLDRVLQGATLWITGVRHDQTDQRKALSVLSRMPTGKLKLCPFLPWDSFDLDVYLYEHPELLPHPLAAQGYRSIGCQPCTSKGENRDGRWMGQQKTECGLHRRSVG